MPVQVLPSMEDKGARPCIVNSFNAMHNLASYKQ